MNNTEIIQALQFRASGVGDLMGKTGLGKTGQKKAIQTYLAAKYGRTPEISSKYLSKGNNTEAATIKQLSEYMGVELVKNTARLHNEHLTGECDLLTGDTVIDVKSSWGLFSYFDSVLEYDPKHEWQLRAYMMLYDRPKSILVYSLTNSDDATILDELHRETYKWPEGDVPEWREAQIITNHVFDRAEFERWVNIRGLGGDELTDRAISAFVEIPVSDRICKYEFERTPEAEQNMVKRIKEAKQFLINKFG